MKNFLPKDRVFIIAEAGVNHNGDVKRAKELIDIAVDAGADAVKFQTFKTEKMASVYAHKAQYQEFATGQLESQSEMLKKLELTQEEFKDLYDYCKNRILFMSTPFDEESADFLDKLGMKIFKVPSGELTNLALIGHIARKGKPMIVSTGMATLQEVKEAVDVITQNGNPPFALLHCVSLYPVQKKEELNLRAIETLRNEFKVPTGFSDHMVYIEASLIAVHRVGAQIIEKHFTKNKKDKGPDQAFSLEPEELGELVRWIRNKEKFCPWVPNSQAYLGNGKKEPVKREEKIAEVARKSVVATQDITVGDKFTKANVAIKRPGYGIPPKDLAEVLRHTACADIKKDQVIQWAYLK